MLEKGLRFVQQRNEELDNYRFQIKILSQNLATDNAQAKNTLDKLLVEYNNWMYPHLDLERKDFARDSAETFQKLKGTLDGIKFKATPVDPNEQFKVTVGT